MSENCMEGFCRKLHFIYRRDMASDLRSFAQDQSAKLEESACEVMSEHEPIFVQASRANENMVRSREKSMGAK